METLGGWLDHLSDGQWQEVHRDEVGQFPMGADDLEPRQPACVFNFDSEELDAFQVRDLKLGTRPSLENVKPIVAQALVVPVMPEKARAPCPVKMTMRRHDKGDGDAVGIYKLEGGDR